MKKIIIFILIITLFLISALVITSCGLFGASCNEVNSNSTHYFWSVNINPGLFGEPYCEIGTRDPVEFDNCTVYMEYDFYDSNVIDRVGTEFDAMYDVITQNFGDPVLAPDNNGKVTILLLDIIDGFDGVTNPSYVGGYFYSVDYVTQESLENAGYTNDHSNERAMLYIDIDPQDVTKDDVYSTVAHEFQHMINFSENTLDGGSVTPDLDLILSDAGTPTWIDEGFAMGAEQIWAVDVKNFTNPSEEWPVYSRISYFNNSERYLEGNPLIKWIRSESEYDVLSNYSNSFLFFQYLRVHSSLDSDIFKTMMDSSTDDIGMIDEILSTITTAGDFQEAFENWLIANRLNLTNGEYGYMNAEGLSDVKSYVGADSKSWGFYPGSFMYRKDCGSAPGLSGSMKALKFTSTGSVTICNGCSVGSNEYLVIYNTDENPDGSAINVDVPAGTFESGGVTKGYNDSGPQRIDWLIKKPLSEYDIRDFYLQKR